MGPGTLRLDKKVLFERLGYAPHPGQLEVHHSIAPRRVLACGARWGKSVCASAEAVCALLAPCDESIGWVVAPSYDLTERIFRRVEVILSEHFEHRIVEQNTRDRRLVVNNLGGGVSELRAKSADNPTSLLGEGLDWLIVDEAARLRDEVWEGYLSQRLVDRNGWALFVSTPKGANWFYRLFRQSRIDPGFQSWSFPTADNPHLDVQVIEAERKRLDEVVFAQEYEAVFIGAELEPCIVCEGPSRDAVGVCLVEAGEEVPLCHECGEPVNEEGKTLVRLTKHNQPDLVILILDPCEDITEGNEPEPPVAAPDETGVLDA